tara:strand:- start:937 stop:1575 length:639 start_codon:yes stop_codon:yes gene_type:complete
MQIGGVIKPVWGIGEFISGSNGNCHREVKCVNNPGNNWAGEKALIEVDDAKCIDAKPDGKLINMSHTLKNPCTSMSGTGYKLRKNSGAFQLGNLAIMGYSNKNNHTNAQKLCNDKYYCAGYDNITHDNATVYYKFAPNAMLPKIDNGIRIKNIKYKQYHNSYSGEPEDEGYDIDLREEATYLVQGVYQGVQKKPCGGKTITESGDIVGCNES